MAIRCTGTKLLALFPVKGLQIFMIFKGRPREEAQGSPRRPKEGQGAPKGAKRIPRGAQGEPKGAPNGAKRSKQGRQLYKLTPDQPQSGRYVLVEELQTVRLVLATPKRLEG